MKKFLSNAIVLVGLFTLNAQADEIVNNADLHNLTLVELSHLQTDGHAVNNDHQERFDFHDLTDSGHALGVAQSGLYQLTDLNLTIEGTTTPYSEEWSVETFDTANRESNTGIVPLRFFRGSGTYLQEYHYTPEGRVYTIERTDRRAETKPDGLACTCEVGHCRPNRT